ncbi:PrgI family protein [Candidatus Gribaldobacteria bacterium]|nr:PrgI family protein [Candidatus Gribaldobacteria bacterium]
MQFTVPKFLERESTIAFGLTFKKLAVMGFLGFLVFILWYVLPKPLTVMIAIVLALLFSAGAFVKINGNSLPDLAGYLFRFLISSRLYTWAKKEQAAPIRFVKKTQIKAEEKQVLKIAPESRLRNMSSMIELGNKSAE